MLFRSEPAIQSLFLQSEGSALEKVIKLNHYFIKQEAAELLDKIDLQIYACPSIPFSCDISPEGKETLFRRKNQANKGLVLKAPMTGKILQVLKSEDEPVKKGEVLVIIEAMKMENNIPAPASGVLTSIQVAKGDMIQVGSEIAKIKMQ